jgi:hypothetical protein
MPFYFCVNLQKHPLISNQKIVSKIGTIIDITFWGEIDRQNLLASESVQEVEDAVKEVYSKLWSNGRCMYCTV